MHPMRARRQCQVKSGAQQNITVFIFQLLKTAIQRDVTRCPGKVRLQKVVFLSAGAPRASFTAAESVIYLPSRCKIASEAKGTTKLCSLPSDSFTVTYRSPALPVG
jgi:hypothetical protein